jgi:integrase
MKRKGRHPDRELSAVRVKNLSDPGRYADGNGLYLVVDPSGAKRWMLRTVIHGRRRDMGLGSAQLVSLLEAREQAQLHRAMARRGEDPVAKRRSQRRMVPTFESAATTVHASNEATWRNAKHAAQWLTTLKTYAFPGFGETPVDRITTADVLKVLAPIWLKRPETARRVRQRIGTVMDWAKAAGHRSGDNPVEGVERGLPRQTEAVVHHKALAYTGVPDFIEQLRDSDAGAAVKLAFELLILTAARTGELINARWSEFDLEQAVWTIPADRMKARREHRVPLCERALEVLVEAKRLAGASDYAFPGRSPARPLSNMAFLMTLRRTGHDVTAHGFRSAFRDWASERTNFPREVCEMALAHVVKDKTEAAYRRGDLFEKRKALMKAWESYLASEPGKVVALYGA